MTQPFIQEEITEEDFVFFNKKEIEPYDSILWDLIGMALGIIIISFIVCCVFTKYDFNFELWFLKHYFVSHLSLSI